jgi:hypothetical protein
MRTRIPLLALVAGVVLALAPAANAATPFTAGTGQGHDLAVGSDGKGHVAWIVEGADDRVAYCRVPAGGSACELMSFLDFAGPGSSSPSPHVQVFTPAAGKVVVLAACTQCPSGETDTKTYRFTSLTNGSSWGGTAIVGSIQLNGQASYVDSGNTALSVSGSVFQGQDASTPTTTLTLGSGGASTSASTAVAPSGTKAVYAVTDISPDAVKYRVFTDPATGTPINVTELNDNTPTFANWGGAAGEKILSNLESDPDETRLDSGPNGIFLTYVGGPIGDRHIFLRRFDTDTNTFASNGAAIEGSDPIEDAGIGESMHSQDPSGRLHVVWRTLFDGNRLRYTRSDTGGGNFSAPANLAVRETFFNAMVDAGPDGNGFAVWRSSGDAVRVVPIDPQPEPSDPGGPGGPDTTPPTAGSPRIGDSTLTPGQGTTFTFTSSEAGIATLTVQKQVKGLKVKVRGKRQCVPQTRKRLRALRRRAGSPRAFRRLLRRSRCKAYKRIGSIKQAVVPGQNTIVFSGRIAGRKLRPGRYRALLVIRDSAGNLSRVERVRFRVLRRRR